MDIKLESGEIIQNVFPMKSIEDITSDSKMYYELGGYQKWNSFKKRWEGWRRSGVFKKIKNPIEFKKRAQYKINNNIHKNCSDPSYISHHNFVIKNNQQ